MNRYDNPYEILQVSNNATPEEIKSSFKKLAKQYHPDKNPGNVEDAERQFQRINDAYQLLSSPDRKQKYDQRFSSFPRSFPNRRPSFDSLYDHFFKYRKDYSDKDNNQLGDINVDVFFTLEEIFQGATKRVSVDVYIDNVSEKKMFDIRVNPGMKDGSILNVKGGGNKEIGEEAYDIHFIIKTQPHQCFDRQEDDLMMKVELNLKESLCGKLLDITCLDNEQIKCQIDGPIPPGSKKVIHDKGMIKEGGKRGDIILEISVKYPKYLSEEQKLALAKILTD